MNSPNIKYKFFHNGDGWWLRIETVDELLKWLEDTGSMWSNAFSDALQSQLPNGNHSSTELGSALITYARIKEMNLINATASLSGLAAQTKLKYLLKNGFININPNGGFNFIDWPMLQIEYRDNLIFPHYSESDIRVKTFKPIDYREGYKYHYYAYIGNLQVSDGEITKWDTYDEAFNQAKKYIEV